MPESTYRDVVQSARFDEAVARAIRLHEEAPARPVEACAEEALTGAFAQGGPEAPDVQPIFAALADEVARRVRAHEGADVVEEASEESFPASDPPGYGPGHL